jgi:hypothetical protein
MDQVDEVIVMQVVVSKYQALRQEACLVAWNKR